MLNRRWLFSGVAAAIAGVVLGFGGLTPTGASAGVSHSHLYTHGSSSCTSHVDPINDIFVKVAYWQWVDNHAGHHGGWTYNDGSDQWFKAHICQKHDGSAASNSSLSLDRYHMRMGQGWKALGSFDIDQAAGWDVWSAADAHHEYTTWCGHATDDVYQYPPGGFNRGRDDIWDNWVNNGPHGWPDFQRWGNTMRFTQCNGWVAWSDGYVDFIDVVSYFGH